MIKKSITLYTIILILVLVVQTTMNENLFFPILNAQDYSSESNVGYGSGGGAGTDMAHLQYLYNLYNTPDWWQTQTDPNYGMTNPNTTSDYIVSQQYYSLIDQYYGDDNYYDYYDPIFDYGENGYMSFYDDYWDPYDDWYYDSLYDEYFEDGIYEWTVDNTYSSTGFLDNVWSWIVNAAQWVWEDVIVAVADWLWNDLIVPAAEWVYSDIIVPVADWAWELLQDTFNINPILEKQDFSGGKPAVQQTPNWCNIYSAYWFGCNTVEHYAMDANAEEGQMTYGTKIFTNENFEIIAGNKIFDFLDIKDYFTNKGAKGIVFSFNEHTVVICGYQVTHAGNVQLYIMDPAYGSYRFIDYKEEYGYIGYNSFVIGGCK